MKFFELGNDFTPMITWRHGFDSTEDEQPLRHGPETKNRPFSGAVFWTGFVLSPQSKQ
ncbi:hypothetical protein [Pseudoxanthomonas mexicana]|uniref:hypothetical protein n=1 Tax=Pseudoxanthomonas mexicana TaxID=128785 RepID=UPI00398B7D09